MGTGLSEFVYEYVFRADSQPASGLYGDGAWSQSVLGGIIEGFAEATALLTKMFPGVLSDYWGKRKLLTVIGYGMAAVTKPLFPLASSLATVFLRGVWTAQERAFVRPRVMR